MGLDQKRCMLQDSNQRLRPEMICLFPIKYNDFQKKNHTCSGTVALANTWRNCPVNSPMRVKGEVGRFEVFTTPLICATRNYAESARNPHRPHRLATRKMHQPRRP